MRIPLFFALLLCAFATYAAANTAPNVDPNTIVESLPLPNSFLDMLAVENAPDSTGASQNNRVGRWVTVNYQIGTDRLVTAGLHEHNPQYIADALNVADYAFAHQNPDGSFIDAKPSEQVGATGGFILYLSHSLLMLQQSPWFQGSPDTATLRARAQSLYRPLSAALNWFLPQANILRADRVATNRILSYGTEYYLAGKLLGNTAALNLGRWFIEEGLNKQFPDGTFPEVGGFDSSYQNVSLLLGQVIFLQMPATDPLRDRLWTAIQRGAVRELRNLMPSGEISTAGNTRIHPVPGAPGQHQLDRHTAVLAQAYYAAITGDPQARQNVQLILGHYFPQ